MEEPELTKRSIQEDRSGEHRGPSGEGNRSVRFSGQSWD